VQHLGRGGGTAASAPRVRVAGTALLTAYLLAVGWLAFRPLSVPWVAPANLRPLATIRADLDGGPWNALNSIGGGLLLLAPLGVLLPLAAGRLHRTLPGTLARTVFAGALTSSLIVLLQSGVPGRVVDVDAVLLNTAGVALACLLVFPPVRSWLRRRAAATPLREAGRIGIPGAQGPPRAQSVLPRREETGQGATPRTARVGIAP